VTARRRGGSPGERSRRDASSRARRAGPGAIVVTGKRSVLEAIASGRARGIVVDDAERASAREVVAAAEAAGVPVRAGDVQDPDGVLARVSLPRELSESDLARRVYGEDALVVVLDGITDPQNLGASARSAEAAGAELMVTRERRAAPTTSAAVRASAGALLHLPLARVANIPRALDRLKNSGFIVIGLDERAERSIYEAPAPEERLALVIGAEGRGLSRLVAERCDDLRSLPMRGRVSSLNASAALAAGLFGFVVPSRRRT